MFKVIKRFGECTVVRYEELNANYRVSEDIDGVIISGSEARIVDPSNRNMFKGTIDIIKKLKIPIFSICYGYQLLCWSFGASVASLDKPVKDRFEKVRIIEADEIFNGFEKGESIPLAEWHYDYVLKASLNQAGFVLLADSHSCEVEAVKHKHSPFYGVQFHPERGKIKNQSHSEGYKIIQNFYRNVVKR
ncbi:MAG: gamma-glutamyl-gamma-aminobutyrate hydrolase family protein [Nitrososphaerales archaeon]